VPDGQLQPRWPEPPAEPKAPPGVQAWTVLRRLQAGGWLRPRRIGCLLLVLVLLLFAVLWVASFAINGMVAKFDPERKPVTGTANSTFTPPPSSGSPTIDRITQRGWLIVGVDEAAGLAEGSPAGEYTGFDVELARLVARDLGVDPAKTEFKELPVSLAEQRVGAGKEIQLVLGGYEVTAQRRAEGRVAGPHLVSPLRLAVPAGSPVTSLDSLGDGQVCAPEGSAAAAALADRVGKRLVTRRSLDACAQLLRGPVQAIAADQAALHALPALADGRLRLVGEPLGTAEYGFGLPSGDEVFRERINAVLRRAIADGTWARLYAEHLGTPVPAPPLI
jgi:glutamate transport system substrate-binding protein